MTSGKRRWLALPATLGAPALGAAGVSTSMAWAWALAWPLTQLGLLARPDLLHDGGLSGVLHAEAAVAGVHLVGRPPRLRRLIGLAILGGLALKVWGEAPGGPALRHPAGRDIATAPYARASGLCAGLACALAALAWERTAGRAETA